MPLRTQLNNGDMVEILKSKAQEPQPTWFYFVTTGKARAAIRRHVRHRERDELVAIGRKLYEDIAAKMPGKIGKKALDVDGAEGDFPNQERAISIRGLTPDVGYHLGDCCHSIPEYRI